MDACHSTSSHDYQQSAAGELFRTTATYEADLRAAAGRIGAAADSAATAGIKLVEAGVDDFGTVDAAVGALRVAAGFLNDARLIAEVLEQREEERLQHRERRNFLELIAVQPRTETDWKYRLTLEAKFSWMISIILKRMAEAGVVTDHKLAWPHIDMARMEELHRQITLPSPAELKVMNGEALVEVLHELEGRSAEIRKLLGLINALRHVAKA